MSATKFPIHETDGVFVIRPTGYLDENAGLALRGQFDAPIQKGVRKFLLDLSGAPVINSQGITQILELVETLVYDQKASFGLIGLSDLYADVFHVIGLTKLVKVFPSEADAITGL
jgi:anti-anti-sigma factor